MSGREENFIKKILVVITTKMTPYDGMTTVAMNYYRYMDHGMFHMDFASTNDIDRGTSEELKGNGSRYIKLPRRGSPLYMLTLYKLLKRYDIVHIHGNSATTTIELIPSVFARVKKRIIHIHNTTCSHKTIHRLLKPIFDKCYTDAIACSKLAGSWIFTNADYIILNNAIDLGRYHYDPEKREKIRRRYMLEDDSFVVGHVGRFAQQKNHMFLMDIFHEILKTKKRARLMLIGDGELRNEINKKSADLGIKDNVIFCGVQDDASDFFSAFDCFVFPSLWEGLGLVLLEAQANGLDCIISDSIPDEAEVSDAIQRISLTQDAAIWAGVISHIDTRHREARSICYCDSLQACGYDIKKNVSVLEDFYLYRSSPIKKMFLF
jgi:Glycosyltransferase